jgi:hypothetical protein
LIGVCSRRLDQNSRPSLIGRSRPRSGRATGRAAKINGDPKKSNAPAIVAALDQGLLRNRHRLVTSTIKNLRTAISPNIWCRSRRPANTAHRRPGASLLGHVTSSPSRQLGCASLLNREGEEVMQFRIQPFKASASQATSKNRSRFAPKGQARRHFLPAAAIAPFALVSLSRSARPP